LSIAVSAESSLRASRTCGRDFNSDAVDTS
jgi:hypothetical protein